MASYVPAKYGAELIFYVGLDSVATAGAFQANPTLASGDVKISKDGGTLANLTTLPTVTPASGKLVKVTVSATEMQAENVAIVFSDASGGEWKDLILNIPTAVRQIDDLATPTNITAGTITTVTNLTNAPTNGDLTATMKTSVTTAATAATPTVTAGTVSDKSGYSLATTPPTAAQIRTEIDSNSTQLAKLGTPVGASVSADIAAVKSDTAATLTDTAEIGTAGAGLTALASATNLATLAGYVDTEVAAIKAKTDSLPASPAATGDIPSASSIAAAVWAYVVEGAYTAVQVYRIIASVLAGKSTGGGTTSVAFRDLADSKNRVSATVDADGNRTATTLDGS